MFEQFIYLLPHTQSRYCPASTHILVMASDPIMKRKLIIDTDTGVDDAMALLMALEAHKRGEVEVLAITAVAGNTEERHALRNILRTIGTHSAVQCSV